LDDLIVPEQPAFDEPEEALPQKKSKKQVEPEAVPEEKPQRPVKNE
jgi:hypothetical protein